MIGDVRGLATAGSALNHPPQTEIQRETGLLQTDNMVLSDLLEVLHDKLIPVMRPESLEKDAGPDVREETNTSMGSFLAEQSRKTRRNITAVQNIIRRLEV